MSTTGTGAVMITHMRFSNEKLRQLIDRWPEKSQFVKLLASITPDGMKPSPALIGQWHNGQTPSTPWLPYLKILGGFGRIEDMYEEYNPTSTPGAS